MLSPPPLSLETSWTSQALRLGMRSLTQCWVNKYKTASEWGVFLDKQQNFRERVFRTQTRLSLWARFWKWSCRLPRAGQVKQSAFQLHFDIHWTARSNKENTAVSKENTQYKPDLHSFLTARDQSIFWAVYIKQIMQDNKSSNNWTNACFHLAELPFILTTSSPGITLHKHEGQ